MNDIYIYGKIEQSRGYRVLSDIGDQLNEHWVISSILQTLPVLWVSIYQILKKNQVIDSEIMNLGANIFLGISAAVSICLIGITNFKAFHDLVRRKEYKQNVEYQSAELIIRKAISSAETSIDDRYLRYLVEQISSLEMIDDSVCKFIRTNYDPIKRISAVMDELRYCFEKVSRLPKDRIYMSAAINSVKDKWEWITTVGITGTASISELVDNPSVFRRISEENIPYIYENDKEIAANEGRYYWDKKDISSKRIGSIICWEISREIKGVTLRMIISISSYGERICEDNISKEEMERLYNSIIKDTILYRFEGRLTEALIFYAIQEKIV